MLTARCNPGERSLLLQPLLDALGPELSALPEPRLRELAGARADALVGLLPDLGVVLGPATVERVSPDAELRRAFEAVSAVLRGLAAERPTLLVLDDLHNAGLATVELLAYLDRRVARARLLVLATVRAEEGVEMLDTLQELAARIDLGPLSAAAVAELAAAAGRPELATAILGRTRGHTLFVVETLRGLLAGESGIPDSLQAVVLSRLRRAGSDTEETLRASAVLGMTVDPAVVAVLLDLPAHVAAGRCAQAAEARLLVEAGRAYEFVNDLVQEVVYATTAGPVRAALHRRAADVLTADPTAVARHAAAVEDWDRAARALLLAAEETRHRYAMADAEALLTEALAAAERTGEPELIGRATSRAVRSGRPSTCFGPHWRTSTPHRRPPGWPGTGGWRCSRCASSPGTCPSRWATRSSNASRAPRTACGSPRPSATARSKRTCWPGSPCSPSAACGSPMRSGSVTERCAQHGCPGPRPRWPTGWTGSRPPTPTWGSPGRSARPSTSSRRSCGGEAI